MGYIFICKANTTDNTTTTEGKIMSNEAHQRLVTTVISARTSTEVLENRVRIMLDQLAEHVALPYGMVLEGRVTIDRFSNSGLYVFLRVGLETFPGLPKGSNPLPAPAAVEGGKWINLNRYHDFNPQWEARDINKAVAEYRLEHSK
jgi:hypothetical protein